MTTYDLETLREEMIWAFHEYVGTSQAKLHKRMFLWDVYCRKREAFLEQDSYRNGRKYVPLKETMIDTN